ncbi:MAG: hypothetical protein AAGG75_16915 [Bacteroidota bacterium]
MIRWVAVLTLLLSTASSLSAQRDRGSINLGYSYSRFSVEKLSGSSIYGTFSKTFYNPLFINVSASYGLVNRTDTLSDQQLQTFSVGLEGAYAFINDDRQQLKAGAGLSGRFFDDNWILDSTRATRSSAFKPGISLHLSYDVFLSDQWLIGGRALLQRYESDNTVYLLGAHLGFRL